MTHNIIYEKSVKKGPPHLGKPLFWQREKDSNPHIQSQSLLCYPYTIPLYFACLLKGKGYYTKPRGVCQGGGVKKFFAFSEDFSSISTVGIWAGVWYDSDSYYAGVYDPPTPGRPRRREGETPYV